MAKKQKIQIVQNADLEAVDLELDTAIEALEGANRSVEELLLECEEECGEPQDDAENAGIESTEQVSGIENETDAQT